MALKTCLDGIQEFIFAYQSLQNDIQVKGFFVINPSISTISDFYRSRRS